MLFLRLLVTKDLRTTLKITFKLSVSHRYLLCVVSGNIKTFTEHCTIYVVFAKKALNASRNFFRLLISHEITKARNFGIYLFVWYAMFFYTALLLSIMI